MAEETADDVSNSMAIISNIKSAINPPLRGLEDRHKAYGGISNGNIFKDFK